MSKIGQKIEQGYTMEEIAEYQGAEQWRSAWDDPSKNLNRRLY